MSGEYWTGAGAAASSRSDEWATPRALFAQLDALYRFTLDPCATPDNATCLRFFTRADDGLRQDWGRERVFCNPPYGRGETGRWLARAREAADGGALVVTLIPARTDTRAWHEHTPAGCVYFLRGRLRFNDGPNPAPFPSALVIFGERRRRAQGRTW